MYFVARAFKYLKSKVGKTALMGIIFLVIANFVLAGLLIDNASNKAQVETRKTIGADVSYTLDREKFMEQMQKGVYDRDTDTSTLTGVPNYSNFMKIVDSQYVQSYDMSYSYEVNTTDSLTQYTASSSSTDSTEGQGMNFPGSQSSGDFDVKLYSSTNPIDFDDETSTLTEGRLATQQELDSGANVIVISKDVADLNSLKLGDSISMTTTLSGYEDVEISYEIIGIFESSETVDDRMASRMGASLLPQNRFYVPFNAIKNIGVTDDEISSMMVSTNRITLTDPMYVDEFKAEAAGKVDLQYGTIDANDTLYNQLMKPIENLGYISGMLVIIIIVAGALIIGLITSLTINERKEEIGILLAVGEGKIKIISQLVLEVVVIAVIAFSLSMFSGQIIGDKISSLVLNSNILSTSTTTDVQGFNQGGPGGFGGFGRNSSTVSESTLEQLQQQTELDISLSPMVILKLFGLGLLLPAVSTIIPSLYVMRYNPKQILTNRNS